MPELLGLELSVAGLSARRDPRIAQAVRGDSAAIAGLYDEHHTSLRAFACRLIGDLDAAEDLVHDVFVDLPRALARYRGESSLTTFLRAVAVHRAQRHLRAAARRRKAMARLAQETEREGRFAPSELRARELARRLSAAMDQLSLEQRAALVLCEVEELSAEEAGRVLNIPASTVRTRVFYGRRKLAELLGGEP